MSSTTTYPPTYDPEQWQRLAPALFETNQHAMSHQSFRLIYPGTLVRINSLQHPQVAMGDLALYLGIDDTNRVYVVHPQAGELAYYGRDCLQVQDLPQEVRFQVIEALAELKTSQLSEAHRGRFAQLLDRHLDELTDLPTVTAP